MNAVPASRSAYQGSPVGREPDADALNQMKLLDSTLKQRGNSRQRDQPSQERGPVIKAEEETPVPVREPEKSSVLNLAAKKNLEQKIAKQISLAESEQILVH